MPSIHDQNLTGDQTRSIAEKEHSGVGGILNGSLASERNEGLDGTLRPGDPEAAHAFGSDDGSGSDDVRTNAPRSFLDGDHARESVDASLGGGSVGLVRKTFKRIGLTPDPLAQKNSFINLCREG